MSLDVVIVGGGPAGLSAALVLGRARRTVVLIDDAPSARNGAARAVHGVLAHDGIAPAELRRIAHADLARYPTVSWLETRAIALERGGAGRVRVELADGRTHEARRVLLACGLVDALPKIPGLRERWGRDAFSCPFCHGWEARDRVWGVLALQKTMLGAVPTASAWTRDVIVFANGRTDLDPAALDALARAGARVEPRPVVALGGDGDRLEHVEVSAGSEGTTRVPCGALWLRPAQRHVDLVLYAGLGLDDEGLVRVDAGHETSMRGVHACGDMASGARPHAIEAAASGARAALDLVQILLADASR